MSKVSVCIMGIICIMSLNDYNAKRLLGLLQDDSLYCISVDNATGCIITSCIGIQCLDNPLKDTYMSIDELPDWVKGKIAVLNMVELIKDTNGQEYTEIVDGVGYRLGNTYYIGPLTS